MDTALKITPGPWAILGSREANDSDEYDFRIVQASTGGTVCNIGITSGAGEADEANARAIVAVPNMIEALQACNQCITDFLEIYRNGGSMLVMDEAVKSLRTDALKLTKSALSKALNP